METPPELLTAAAKLVGWVLLHSLWQGTAIALLLALALLILRRQPAAARHIACLLALIAMLLSSAVTTWILVPARLTPVPIPAVRSAAIEQNNEVPHFTPERSAFVEVGATVAPQLVPLAVDAPSAGMIAGQRLDAALPWISAVWLIGVLLLSLRHAG